MNTWENAVITQKGLALQSKLIQGNSLIITRAVIGSGYVSPSLLREQTAVTNPVQELVFSSTSYPAEGKCALTMRMTNDEVQTAYLARQIGVYATDPDEGEILYFIMGAPTETGGTDVPSATEMPGWSSEWEAYFQYGQADDVTVVVDPSNTVSKSEMEAYVKSEIVSITIPEIDAILGDLGSGGSTGDSGESGGEAGTGVYTLDHSLLYNRDAADQHPIESITGLEDALTAAEGKQLDSTSVETAWANATTEQK